MSSVLSLDRVTKSYRTRWGGRRVVLDNVSFEFPRGTNVGLLGLNGAGKSTLIRLLAGAELPDKGSVRRSARISFPLGFDGVFHPYLTGRDNIDFVSRVYNENPARITRYVEAFAELGDYFDMPIATYSTGMRAKLAFGTCLALDFDVYLIDEITEVGDGAFRERAISEFKGKLSRADVIIVSHNTDTIQSYCDIGAILHSGKLRLYGSLEKALSEFKRLTIPELSS